MDDITRKHFECVVTSTAGARRVFHEYTTDEAAARRMATEDAATYGIEVKSIVVTESA